jgi:hypothetical protein
MSNNKELSKDLFLKLKGRFPEIKLGDINGMSTVKPGDAVFFDFDFVVNDEKVASVSISVADVGILKIIVTKDILENTSEIAKKKWFQFQREMRNFSKQNLLSFEPSDITKSRLDTKDYQEIASIVKDKDPVMSESSLYGSTRSSYQTMENTRLIIRHSKKIKEESANSRTRNIDAIYIESANGERFRYPFVHLSGARAMQRHIANEGTPYDIFGQYIVGLSEQAYHLRKFNNIVSRKQFLENSEVTPIAHAARFKFQNIKKTLENIQKQHGYLKIKENFQEVSKKELDQKTLESLKSKFTVQQFNEELAELFPYISDLLEASLSSDNFTPDDIASLQQITDLNDVKNKAFELITTKSKRPMQPDKVAYLKRQLASKRSTMEVIKLMYDLLLSGEGSGVIGSRRSMEPSNYRKSFGEAQKGKYSFNTSLDREDGYIDVEVEYVFHAGYKGSSIEPPEPASIEITNVVSAQGPIETTDEENEILEKEAQDHYQDYQQRAADDYGDWKLQMRRDDGIGEEQKGYDPSDAADEPWDNGRNPIQDFAATIESLPEIQIEKFDKASIQAGIDNIQNQIQELTQAMQDNPKDKKTQYSLEKAQARLKLLQARLASADPQTSNIATRNALLIDHLSKHVKDDRLSLQLARISDDYQSFKKPEMKMINELIRAMMAKAKLVDMFAEETSFNELSSMLSANGKPQKDEKPGTINHLASFENFLNSVTENNDLLSSDSDIQSQALSKLSRLMSSHFPAGTNGINAIESLEGIIDDEGLFEQIKAIAKKNSDTCVRPLIIEWIKQNAPDLADKLTEDTKGNIGEARRSLFTPEKHEKFKTMDRGERIEYLYNLVKISRNHDDASLRDFAKKSADEFRRKYLKGNGFENDAPVKKTNEENGDKRTHVAFMKNFNTKQETAIHIPEVVPPMLKANPHGVRTAIYNNPEVKELKANGWDVESMISFQGTPEEAYEKSKEKLAGPKMIAAFDDENKNIMHNAEKAMRLKDAHKKQNEEFSNDQHSSQEIVEFVKSLYDSTTGKFPKGETGVLTSVEKKFGESAKSTASQIIEQLKQQFDENLMRLRKLAGVS